jgi:hypothetical protein
LLSLWVRRTCSSPSSPNISCPATIHKADIQVHIGDTDKVGTVLNDRAEHLRLGFQRKPIRIVNDQTDKPDVVVVIIEERCRSDRGGNFRAVLAAARRFVDQNPLTCTRVAPPESSTFPSQCQGEGQRTQ